MQDVAGLTPRQWEERLEAAVDAPDRLAQVLAALEQEMRRESTWLHEHPSPDGMLAKILDFFARPDDDDVEALGLQLNSELQRERSLRKRYRSWRPSETWGDRLAPYLKQFGGEMRPTLDGLQFPGFSKYDGIAGRDAMTFFLSDSFPGRDPANFHTTLSGDAAQGIVVLKRIYKKELPRIEGISTVGRAVLAEMIRAHVPDVASIKRLEIDNAANRDTRKALIAGQEVNGEAVFEPANDADPSQTILGHLLIRLAEELGLTPGELTFALLPFGMLRLQLVVTAP